MLLIETKVVSEEPAMPAHMEIVISSNESLGREREPVSAVKEAAGAPQQLHLES